METQRGWPCREGGYGALKGVFISEKTVLTIGHPGYTDGGVEAVIYITIKPG